MSKNFKIFAGRQSLFGDIVAYLPFLTYLEKTYLDSYKIYSLAKKCSQFIPFLINHPLIDKILITKEQEGLKYEEMLFAKSCNLFYNPNPALTDNSYFNKKSLIEETFLMNELIKSNLIVDHNYNENLFRQDQWNSLTAQEKKPFLNQWFDIDKQEKTIAIWPFAGYANRDNKRSPSIDWWIKMVCLLNKEGYKVLHFGHSSNPIIKDTINLTKLNLFDSIKTTLGCDLALQSDTGAAWIVGAYGFPQIVLYTNYVENHVNNFDAFVPPNYKNNIISLFSKDNIDLLNQEKVLENIKKLK